MGKYILVTGGELRNKGAQAMSFITVDEMAKRFPDMQVVLLSERDSKRSVEEKNQYKFKIISSPRVYLLLLSPIFKKMGLLHKFLKNKTDIEFFEILYDTDLILDISGYSIGTNWKVKRMLDVCPLLHIAQKLNIPFYFMPQSFGPFEFNSIKLKLAKRILARSLKSAQVIMAREAEGKHLLETVFHLKNVVKTTDLVLSNKGIDPSNIYHVAPEFKEISIRENSIAIIPNFKTTEYGNQTELYNFYHNVIQQLLDNGKNVYFIYHATEDLKICRELKDTFFACNDSVSIIETELNCIEYSNLVKKFDFIIASRYHSIVHSYKEGVPALIIGWAIKYQELAKLFQQEKYCLNVLDKMEFNHISNVLEYMIAHYEEESQKINAKMVEMQSQNVYEYIEV